MTILKTQTVDLFISHHQISLQDNITINESRWNRGELNCKQEALLHPDYLTFDPVIDNAFGATVHLSTADVFELDKHVKRAIFTPFKINNPEHLVIASVPQRFNVELELKPGFYHVYYEMCEDFESEDKENSGVFYKFTLIKQPMLSKIIRPHYLIDDAFGDDSWPGKQGKELVIGKADKPFTMKLGRMQRYLRSLGISVTKSCQIFVDINEENRSKIKRSIGWHPPGGSLCIAYDFEPGEGWSVFYAERGGRYDLQTFADEADACYAFIYRFA